ncbi:hypothetical protein F5Y16DRAFT_315295 [Xylariaceae sp. FL0255]|nr:hypothetical protein F5Y16DRAFT_315295 [Xylariaceae sp. FL0255]
MEIPSRYTPREPGGPPPAIYIDDKAGRFGNSRSHSSNFSPSSIPMSIPSNRRIVEDDSAPPPLPPPRFLPGMEPSNHHHHHDRVPSNDSNASFDSFKREREEEKLQFQKKPVARSYLRDEGYHSLTSNGSSSLASQDSLPRKFFMSHDHFQFNKPAPTGSDYDNRLLKKLDSRRTFDNRSPPRRSAMFSSVDTSSQPAGPDQRLHPSAPPLSLPLRLNHPSLLDSPGRLTDTPISTTMSPRSTSLWRTSGNEYRSPIEPLDMDRSPIYRSRRNNSDDATMSTQSSYDNADDTDYSMVEGSAIRRLHIDDSWQRGDHQAAIGQKRRASSPPGGDSPPGLAGELVRRREGVARGSPAPRLSVVPPSSMPSMALAGHSGSYMTPGPLSTSISGLSPFSGKSPSGISSAGLSPVDMGSSPFSTPISLSHSACTSFGRGPHQRNLSNNESRPLASPRKVSELPKASISKLPGGYFMCECCPKKPKKYETAEELSAHEAEKQYECNFCGNRFKNKNEAERHQNSLHVRRHSWSCSALLISGFDRAFHESTTRPGEADTCGYCGEEFSRSGGVGRSRIPTEVDWDERLRHLQEVHKYRECNSGKKFYRADHFRQHLKHSHAGTSGKWTNMLENACMLEEEPPQPSR